MQFVQKLPLSKQISYAIGQLGWATLMNIVNLQLVYFYRPPAEAKMPIFITQAVFLVVMNALVLLAASGRLFDAITDPFIANWSDRFESPRGRRIPFLMWSAIPTALFCALLFFPVVQAESVWNIVSLFVVQLLFYLALTCYVTPLFALLPELGHTSDERLNLSTWLSVAYALGIVLASQVPAIGKGLGGLFGIVRPVTQLQFGISLMAVLSAVFMLVPVWTIDEKQYSQGVPSDVPMLEAIKKTFRNRNFIYYVVADLSYFMGLTIMTTGLLYYVTVLLELNEKIMGLLLPLLVVLSFTFYPVVNVLAKKIGKKILISGSFFWMSVIFMMIFFLGRLPIDNTTQAYLLIITYALPISFLGILPNAVLADIAEHDAKLSGVRQEGMFFAVRTLMQKLGQTLGVFVFAALTSFGKDRGNDLGIRLSGIACAALVLFAGFYFLRYNETQILRELDEASSNE
ncbi:MAG: MFS transporter [Myxococcales bacterium]|nr:MFS transporter [Myxococcales bacterium]